MNRWAAEGGNPFANAKWDEAWKITRVDASSGKRSDTGLRAEAGHWLEVLRRRARSPASSSPASCRASRTSPITLAQSGRSTRRRADRGKAPSRRPVPGPRTGVTFRYCFSSTATLFTCWPAALTPLVVTVLVFPSADTADACVVVTFPSSSTPSARCWRRCAFARRYRRRGCSRSPCCPCRRSSR